MKAGLFAFSVRGIPFDEMLDLAKESHIEAIELGVAGRSTTPGFEVDLLLKDPDRRAEIQESIARRGMVISALNATANPLHPNREMRTRYLEGLKATIRLAPQMGVSRVVTGTGQPGESESSHSPAWVAFGEGFRDVLAWQWREVATPIWKDIAAYATEFGVRICIEILPGTLAYNTDSFLRLRSITGEAVGVNFDPSHMLWQGMDPGVVARALAGCIYHAHAKDTAINQREVELNGVLETRLPAEWAARSWRFCAMGDGHDAVFWRSFVTSLKAAGYDDVWSIEHEDPTLDERVAVRRGAQFIRQLF